MFSLHVNRKAYVTVVRDL